MFQKKIEEEAREAFDHEEEMLKTSIDEQEKRKTAAEAKLASLGIFKISEKKEQKQIIEDAESRIINARDGLRNQEIVLKQKLAGAPDEARRADKDFIKEAEKEYPLPMEPEKPASVIAEEKREQERRKKEEEYKERLRKEEEAKLPPAEKIYKYLKQQNRKMTCAEIAEHFGMTSQAASAHLRNLGYQRRVNKIMIRKVPYFEVDE